jgi:hypothetical protein
MSLLKILNNYAYEKSNKSNSKRDVFVVKAKDRTGAQSEIETRLKEEKIVFYRKKDNALSGSTEVTVIDGPKTTYLVFKPAAGGMNETTLNSTITELAPALAFVAGYNPKSVEDFYNFLKQVNHTQSSVYVVAENIAAGKKFVSEFPNSSKFHEKMENAMGVLKYLYVENKKKKIVNVFWGYRQKPPGVDSKHKGDLFIDYGKGKMVGVSLKAGSETSKEPKLNTYVNPILQDLDLKKINELRLELWNKTYKSFSTDRFNYDKAQEKKSVIEKLAFLEKSDVRMYDKMYDENLDIIRNYLTETFEKNVNKTVKYLNAAIVGSDDAVPLVVLKAYGTNYKILTDEDDVGVFLPKVKKIKSYPSTSSKQDFYIELMSSGSEKLKMKFSVRTNKTGDEHKLGQFFNLAVKFNGIV